MMNNIRKVSPQAGNTQTMDYSSGGENKMFPSIQQSLGGHSINGSAQK